MTERPLNSGRILRRHLITGIALLILPILLIYQTGSRPVWQIMDWISGIGIFWFVWIAVLVLTSWVAFYMADRLIWAGWMRLLKYDLYQEGSFRDLFRKWALCWRCLGYWYGGIGSFLLWLAILPAWYGALYFAFAGASFGAAITALFANSSAQE